MDNPAYNPDAPTPPLPESGEGEGSSTPYVHRQPRPVHDTVVMYKAEIFENLGIQNIPLAEFHELAKLIADSFGIKLGESKRTLVTGRIHPMIGKYRFANHRECLDAIKSDPTGQLLSELANRISTNHTSFYREEAHFEILRNQVLPELLAAKTATGDHDLRIWSAACATGEEAYTLLFTLHKHLGFEYRKWRAGVLATDISAEALQTAKRGLYSRTRLEPVPPDVLNAYFHRIDQDNYEVLPEYRDEVTFRRLNLINDSFPFKSKFAVIFCRNVMIYFSRALRLRLLTRLHDWLAPGGYLFIGHSESLVGTHDGFSYLAPAVYRRSD